MPPRKVREVCGPCQVSAQDAASLIQVGLETVFAANGIVAGELEPGQREYDGRMVGYSGARSGLRGAETIVEDLVKRKVISAKVGEAVSDVYRRAIDSAARGDRLGANMILRDLNAFVETEGAYQSPWVRPSGRRLHQEEET